MNELRSPENQIALRGHGSVDVYDMLWTELNQLDATHILFVLDEIDSIGTDDDILYELPRCNANGNVDDTFVGVVGISNNFQFCDNLSARVKDSLCDEEIHFLPCDAEQFRHILDTRVQPAFRDDVLTDDILPLCAAFGAQESGSAAHSASCTKPEISPGKPTGPRLPKPTSEKLTVLSRKVKPRLNWKVSQSRTTSRCIPSSPMRSKVKSRSGVNRSMHDTNCSRTKSTLM